MRILIVEDDPDTGKLLKAALEEQGYAVDLESDGDRGFRLARLNEYDLIILDNMLPGKHGADICREVRAAGNTAPILILSIRAGTQQKVDLLDTGADDYVTKPFSLEEVTARVKALLRRPRQIVGSILQVEDLVLDKTAFSVTRGKKRVYLTAKEFELLEYLMQNQGRVVSRSTLMEHVWDMNADLFSRTIETHVMRLRKKIDAGATKKLIHTVPGRGYKLDLAR